MRGPRDHELCFGSGYLLQNFGGGVEWIGGGGDGAEHGGRHEGEDELRGVWEEDHDDVAFGDAEVGETGGEFPALEVSFGVGEGSAGGDEAWPVGELREFLEAVGVEWEVGRDGYVW